MLPQLLSIFGTSTSLATIGIGLAIGFSLLFLLIYTIFGFYLYCNIKLFEKAGKPGWAAIIPIYNTWTLFEVGGKPGWLALIFIGFFIPIRPLMLVAALLFLVFMVLVDLGLSKRFGKGAGFAIVLFLFPWIGLPILALGASEYNADSTTSADSPAPPSNSLPTPPTPPVATSPPSSSSVEPTTTASTSPGVIVPILPPTSTPPPPPALESPGVEPSAVVSPTPPIPPSPPDLVQ